MSAAVWDTRREGGEETRKDVGCQWEEPSEGPGGGAARTREVGCQSGGGGVTRDAAVQVDLLNNTDMSSLSVQSATVKAQKRKRGRPRKYQSVSPAPSPSPQEEEEEEDGGMMGGGGEGGGEEEERRGGPEDNSDPTWRPVHPKRPRVIGQRVIGQRSYRHIKVEEGEEPDEGAEPDGRGGARKRRGRRRRNVVMEEEPAELDQYEPEGPVDGDPQRKGFRVLCEPGDPQKKGSRVVCEVCGKVMSCRTNLARHAITHSGVQPFPCSVCGQKFNRYSNAQSHMRRMHSEAGSGTQGRPSDTSPAPPSFLCEMCGRSFNCHSRLRIHVMSHNGIKPYGCHLCPKAYVSAADLHKHIRKVHEEGTSVRYSGGPLLCDRCGREFKCRSLLVAHYRTHTGERPFHCDMCTLKFARPHLLRRHKANIHADGRMRAGSEVNVEEERPFVCQVCGKRLKTQLQLESHVRVHSEERPHSCAICLRGFSSSRTLRNHQLTVHAEGAERRTPARKANAARKAEKEEPETPSPYVCPTCGRDFKFKSTLALHSITHSKEKPHACDLCPQKFGLLGHLKRHREDVHPDGKAGPREPRTFSCPICSQSFRKSRLRLQRHMAAVHGQGGVAYGALGHAPSHHDEGTIVTVIVPGDDEQQDASQQQQEDDDVTRHDDAVAESDANDAPVSVTPLDGDDAASTACEVTSSPPAGETTIVSETPTPSEVTSLDAQHHHDHTVALTPHHHHDHTVALAPHHHHDHTVALTPHHHHHVLAVTQPGSEGCYAQMIPVATATTTTQPGDGENYAQVIAAQSDGGGNYNHMMEEENQTVLMEEEVTQPDLTQPGLTQPDLTQPDLTQPHIMQEVTQPDDMEEELTQPVLTQPEIMQAVTQPDIMEEEVTQPDMMEVTQSVLTQTDIMQEVIQPDIMESEVTQPVLTQPDIMQEVTQTDIMESEVTQTILTQPDIIEEVTQPDIIEEVTQPDIIEEVTQPDIIEEVTQPDIIEEVTQPDIIEEVTQPDIIEEVTQPVGFAQETIIEVTQADPASDEAEEVFVPPPT